VSAGERLAGTRWALLFGNFAIGCGVMVVAGSLNDLTHSLQVSVALGGQLIAIGALVMCFGAPLLAGWVSGFDRRRLLVAALVWYAVGHALCAATGDYAALWPVRALTVLGAAVFTPQAAAAIGHMAPPEQRGRVITFIFLGWSVASVLGMPMSAWIGETFGWRSAFAVVALLSLLAACAVARSMPAGVKPPALSMAEWGRVLRHPVLMAMVAVTALQGAGQFTLLSYLAPYAKNVLQASPAQLSGLFAWFGAFGLLGNLLLSRSVDRVGAGRAATAVLVLTALSLLLWPLATTLLAATLVITPWALACFAVNSAQQARLAQAAPAYAAALMALNSSAIYFGQAVGSASGGWMIAHGGFGPLNWVGLGFVLLAIGLSVWVGRHHVVVA
jgi:predicted MFS family arabinose efflux permease